MKIDHLTVSEYIRQLGEPTPAPGGGSAAALCGALGAALSKMVAGITVGRAKFKDVQEMMETVLQDADRLTSLFPELAQEDADAYTQVVLAFRLPKETDEQKTARSSAVQDALKAAARAPMNTLKASQHLIGIAKTAAEFGNPNALSDALAGVYLAKTAAMIAADNVKINLSSVQDKLFVADCKTEMENSFREILRLFTETEQFIRIRIA